MELRKTLDEEVLRDLALDSPPLGIEKYEEFIRGNFLYYEHDPWVDAPENLTYYSHGEKISRDDYMQKSRSGEKGFCFEKSKEGKFNLETNNAHTNIIHQKSRLLDKFRGYLKRNYPGFLDEYLKLEREEVGLTNQVFHLYNQGKQEELDSLRGSGVMIHHNSIYSAYVAKMVLIMESYNGSVSIRDRITGVEV